MYRRWGKRSLDIFIVFSAFVLLCPLMILIAVLIKMYDPGPVIFKQQRTGQKGKPFTFYKFRSMPVNTGNLPSDQIGSLQLSWIGNVIRRTNLDELPQLLNILNGDMSIVGPRPSIPTQLELIEFRKKNGAIDVRPGLTGFAQINSFDGMSTAQKAQFDATYVENITFLSDLSIILKTFSYLLKKPPVY